MEKRTESRVVLGQPVELAVLDENAGARAPMPASLVDLSGRGAGLLAAQAIEPDRAVRMRWGDRMLLGEVCYCEPHSDGYRIGLQFEHSLVHLEELEKLRQRLLGESAETIAPSVLAG
ncbi:MAG: PilZ domain-containing protein [Bryobacteraceae bacterium]